MIEFLLKLEMSLWINETRNSYEYMDSILHPDFLEFGRSGKRYNKEDILKHINLDINAKFPFKDLNVKSISDTTYLITYQSVLIKEGMEEVSNRSSIWVLTEDNFKLLFHQGTPCCK